jgi:peptide chain release factor subunit 1
VNRQSVISAIVSAQQKLKLYNKLPKNGLCIFTGLIDDKITCIGYEPIKSIKSFFYRCDSKFYVDSLKDMLISDNMYGFIIIDGSSCLFGTLSGNNKNVLKHVHVSLPKKHGRGGQSAQRFGRLREEKRHNYITIMSEYATELFLKENKPIITGLILAGSAELKDDLNQQNILDPRLKNIIVGIVDIAYGGKAGFNQAINLSTNILSNNILIKEQAILGLFFNEIGSNSNKVAFSIKDSFHCLEIGAVEKLILWDSLLYYRYEFKNRFNGKNDIIYSLQNDYEYDSLLVELIVKTDLLEWLMLNYSKYGCELQLVSNNSSEGNQFSKGFGGMGCILRYSVDLSILEEVNINDDEFDNNNDVWY